MRDTRFEITPESYVASVFKPGASFSLDEPAGEVDKAKFLSAYGSAIVEQMSQIGYEDISVTQDPYGLSVLAFTRDGSSIDIGFGLNDKLGLEVESATGVSVQNGNDVDLLFGHWEFPEPLSYEALEAFFTNFEQW